MPQDKASVGDKSLRELQQESIDAIVRCAGLGQIPDDLADVLILFHERIRRLEIARNEGTTATQE